MRILIVEDEQPAAEKLLRMIRQIEPSADLAGPVRSVADLREWLRSHPEPDLMFADIQLMDGLSLEVFKGHTVRCPVIFATAYDEYLLESLEHNSIDYLLKPIKPEQLQRALTKYTRLRDHFTLNLTGFLREYFRATDKGRKQRIVVRKGINFISVPVEDVAFFHTEHKIVFLTDRSGARYIVDKSLSDLEEELERNVFRRVNRRFLVNIASIRTFRSIEKGKLVLDVEPSPSEPIIVSQENASEFKEWMGR